VSRPLHLRPPAGLEGERITTILAQQDIGAFRVTSRAYPARARLPAHVHAGAHVSFVLAGEYTETAASGRRIHRTCSAALHGPGAHHEDVIGATGARDLTVRIPDEWWSRVAGGDIPSAVLENAPPRLTSILLRELSAPDRCSHLLVESVLLDLAAAAMRVREKPSTLPVWLDKADRLIRSRFHEDLRLAMVAREVGIHPVHLARRFRECFGTSVGERIRALRVREACRLLSTTSLALVEIAAACGFTDQSHFCRVFLRETRATPRQYRRVHRR
jgi:AraC family transcriptional regulator